MRRTLITLGTLTLLPAPAVAGAGVLVQVTELQLAGQSSVAVFTVRRGPIDLERLSVTDLDGEPTVLSQVSRQVPEGGTITVSWPKASPPSGAIPFTTHVLAGTEDQLAILLDGELHDAVAWSNRDGTIAKAEQSDLAMLAQHGQWRGETEADLVAIDGTPTVLRRNGTADTQSAADWEVGPVAPPGAGGTTSGDPSRPGTSPLPSSGPADLVLLSAALAVLLRRLLQLSWSLRGEG